MGQGRLFETMERVFRAHEWEFESYAEHGVITFSIEGERGTWHCVAQADEESELFLFHSVLPVEVPEELRTPMGELLHRINFGLRLGALELDFDDGELRYRAGVDCEGVEPADAVIKGVVHAVLMSCDFCLPAIAGLLQDGLDPVTALARLDEE